MNELAAVVVSMPLDALVLEAELQPRALLDWATYEEYLYLLGDGTELPPVVAFSDGETHRVADGFHRWHAHKALGVSTINVRVMRGTHEDALRYSLRANAKHGKRREPNDYARSYEIAVRHGFVSAEDTAAVSEALQCSLRCAYDLTEPARKRIEAERDAEIAAKKAQGKSNAQIARDIGVHSTTVDRKVNSAKLRPAKTQSTEEIPEQAEPRAKHPAEVEFEEMTSARGERWWVRCARFRPNFAPFFD